MISLILSYLFIQSTFSSEHLYQQYKPAVVRINILQDKEVVSLGTGFFISTDGQILTNQHVFNPAFSKDFQVEVIDAQGKIYKEIEVGNCLHPPIDLCFIKVKANTNSYFSLNLPENLNIGKKIFVLGHPRGLDYTLSDGMLSGHRKDYYMNSKNQQEEVDLVQISAPFSPGNSGSPIFNNEGKLIGIATTIRIDQGSQNLNFGPSINEIIKQYKSISYKPLDSYKKSSFDEAKEIAQKLDKAYFTPSWDSLTKNEKSLRSKDFATILSSIKYIEAPTKSFWEERKIKVGERTVKFMLPNFFPPCEIHQSEKSKNSSVSITCASKSIHYGELQITFHPSDFVAADFFNKSEGKMIVTPLPTDRTQSLMDSGKWDEYKKNLKPNQLKYHFSFQTKPTKCSGAKKNDLYFIHDESEKCSYQIFNYFYTNYSALVSFYKLKKTNELISFTGIASEPSFSLPYFTIKNMAELTFKIEN
jgi:hypothetical protein